MPNAIKVLIAEGFLILGMLFIMLNLLMIGVGAAFGLAYGWTNILGWMIF
jgi:hypothetical protein